MNMWASEQLTLCRDDRVGLRAVIAIDDTSLGPGVGGVRIRNYASDAEAILECRHLAATMTRKNALAGIPYGGAKSVIIGDAAIPERAALMRRFGDFVGRTGGSYIPGVDMGTTIEDLRIIGLAGADVSCTERDPSPWTALGVAAAIEAAVELTDHRTGIDGVQVLIQGAGHVGGALARLLVGKGAQVLISDVDPERAASVAVEVGGTLVEPQRVITTLCDVLAPCSIPGVASRQTIPKLGCKIIAGAANDTLDDPICADLLAKHGITYVPDFVASAGGVLHIHAEREQHTDDQLESEVLLIGDRVRNILAEAKADGVTPSTVAERHVKARLAHAKPGEGA